SWRSSPSPSRLRPTPQSSESCPVHTSHAQSPIPSPPSLQGALPSFVVEALAAEPLLEASPDAEPPAEPLPEASVVKLPRRAGGRAAGASEEHPPERPPLFQQRTVGCSPLSCKFSQYTHFAAPIHGQDILPPSN